MTENKIVFPHETNINVDDISMWKKYKRCSYTVMIQKASSDIEYNVKGKKGVVYNKLEMAEESVEGFDYVVTGIVGEMWPITRDALIGYEIDDESEIEDYPKPFMTKRADSEYYAIMIPGEIKFQVHLANGIVLNGNKEGAQHGNGDYVLCNSLELKNYRIVNGDIFDRMYVDV